MAHRVCNIYTARVKDRTVLPSTATKLNPRGYFIHPMINGSGGGVAFWGSAEGETGFNIHVASADGSGAEKLTDDRAVNGHPFWSADGERLVFFSSLGVSDETEWLMSRQFDPGRSPRNIWMMDKDGRSRKQLTFGEHVDERPCISPDGRQVVFVSNRSGRMNLWKVDTDGENLAQLTDHDGLDYRPAFSPDGKYLACFTDANPQKVHKLCIRKWPDGPDAFPIKETLFKWVHGPFWLSDGASILVHAWSLEEDKCALWIVNLQTQSVDKLIVPGFAHYGHGTLSADETLIAFDSEYIP